MCGPSDEGRHAAGPYLLCNGDNSSGGFVRKRLIWGTVSLAIVAMAFGLWVFLQDKPENLQIPSKEWREDLRYLARELPKHHANAFHYTSREEFEEFVTQLDGPLLHSDSDAAWVGLQRLTSLVGDAHTYLQTPRDSADLPIDIARFGAEWRVVRIDPGLKNAIGARVLKIGGVPIERASEMGRELFSRDENPTAGDSFLNSALTTGATLHGLGITPNRNVSQYTLVNDEGREFTLDVHSPGSGADLVTAYGEPPLYMQNAPDRFSCTFFAEASTLYCNVRDILELKEPTKAMLAKIREKNPQKLVIDLRRNRGGDYTLGEKYLIHPIRDLPSINRKGHLFVLISANTFSAAMNNAAQFRTQTAALLVGQEIGEKPNSYQEPRSMTLPNSHLTVRYSTKFYKFVDSGENAVRPDQEIVPTWADYKAGRDPVLEWVLKSSLQ